MAAPETHENLVSSLSAMVDAVQHLHSADKQGNCRECSAFRGDVVKVRWPCPTIRRMADAMLKNLGRSNND